MLRGVAGSGKTSTLKELARGLAQAPLVLAPTNSAVEVLKREGFPHSQTVAGFLLRPPEFNGLVIVDESGLNSLRDGVALLRLAEEKSSASCLSGIRFSITLSIAATFFVCWKNILKSNVFR